MEEKEIKIIKACQKGNLSEFSYLYDTYIDKIYQFIYYRVQHKETAEDITSRVFMKALDKIKSFKTDKGTFQAWLYQIARNSVIDNYRTSKQEIDITNIWDLASDEDVVRDIDVKDKLAQVDKYLSELKPEQREILIMRVWQGMSHKEIAEVLGKSEASCKMIFSRTINKLREEMPLALFLTILLNKF